MALLKINGVDMPTPTNWEPLDSDLHSEDTGRNELGYAQIDRIRQGIFKLDGLEWKGIESAKVRQLKEATSPASFEVIAISEYGFVTKTMYVGDRKQRMARYSEDYEEILWDLSFSLVEV